MEKNTLNLSKEPKHVEPKLYIIILHCGTKEQTEVYQNYTVAYDIDEATKKIVGSMKIHDKAPYKRGLELGGWRLAHYRAISGADLEKMFAGVSRAQLRTNIKSDNNKKNDLMKKILDTKDINLLHASIPILKEHEAEYLHGELTKE